MFSWCANRGEAVDFLVVGPHSALIIVELLEFLYEGCAVDVEASDCELWCWWVGRKI
jgi:hypothetical protein